MTSFSLGIFVVAGDLDGLRIFEKSNWSGKALFPTLMQEVIARRNEFINLTSGGVKHQVQHRFIELRNWVD